MKANDWQGVYTSPLEIGGFSGTILVIEDEPTIRPALAYRQKSYSDVVLDEPIQQDEESGECLSQGDNLFIPRAYSYSVREGVRLGAGITRYTRMNINGYQILMRDDALKHFQRDQSLYDYGILIKVRDTPVSDLNFDTIERKSIRVLQKDSAPPWKDPFVHGPNSSS